MAANRVALIVTEGEVRVTDRESVVDSKKALLPLLGNL